MINDRIRGGNHKSMYLNRTCQKYAMIDVFAVHNANLNYKDIFKLRFIAK